MTTAKFTRQNLPALRAEINAALQALGEKHGMKLDAGNVTFNDAVCTFKLVCTLGVAADASRSAVTIAKDRQEWEACPSWVWELYAPMTPDWLGRSFTQGGHTYRIEGMNGRRQKAPILVSKSGSEALYYMSPASIAACKPE